MNNCTIEELPQSIAHNLYEGAYTSFNGTLDEDIKTSMQLLKKWLKRDMDKLLHEGLWLNHDDLRNKKSAYLEVLYNAFVDICNKHELKNLVDKPSFKGKMNCRRTEIEKNLSYDEKRDSIMKQITDDLHNHIINVMPQKKMSSVMAILENWFEELAKKYYQFKSGDKKNCLYLNNVIIDDIIWFRDKLMTGQYASGQYDNGRKRISYPSIFDVIMDSAKEVNCPYPEDDMDEKAMLKLIIQAVYNMGWHSGLYDCYDAY